jgi:hypothetical protein
MNCQNGKQTFIFTHFFAEIHVWWVHVHVRDPVHCQVESRTFFKNRSRSLKELWQFELWTFWQNLPDPRTLRWQLQSPNTMSMVCERGWGGQAPDSDWSVRPPPPPLLEWHSDVLSCHLWFYIYGCATLLTVELKQSIFKEKNMFANLSLGLFKDSECLISTTISWHCPFKTVSLPRSHNFNAHMEHKRIGNRLLFAI